MLAILHRVRYTDAMRYEIHSVKQIDSTNTAIKDLAKSGASEGYVLVADQQTDGRGRLGRSFYSPAGSGLYASILLRPKSAVSPAALTCLTAVAAADTIFSFGQSCSIKWVNDLYCNGKKAGGILVEGALLPSGRYSYAVVGIGINLSLPDSIPSELQSVLTGVFPSPTDSAFRDQFLRRLCDSFFSYYDRLPTVTFWERYHALQNCFGREVCFRAGDTEQIGIAESIDKDFRLIVRTDSGSVALERGEVVFVSPLSLSQ